MSPFSRRRFLALAAGATAGATGLTACSGGVDMPRPMTPRSPTPLARDRTPATGTITFWSNHPGESRHVELEIIRAFRQDNPDARVALVDVGDTYEDVAGRFRAARGTADLPDLLVVSDVTWFNFALDQHLSPVDDLARIVGLDVADYIDTLYEDYRFQGRHYAVPYARSTPLFFYNADLWKTAGLEDRGPKDWAELREWSLRLEPVVARSGASASPGPSGSVSPSGSPAPSASPAVASASPSPVATPLKQPEVAPLGLPDGTSYLDWVLANLVWEFGGGWSDEWKPLFTDRHTVDALTFLQRLVRDGLVRTSPTAAADFVAGRTACAIASTGELGSISRDARFPVRTAALPGKGNVPTGGAGIGIPAGIDRQRRVTAMKFAAFLTGTRGTSTFSQATGYMPVRKSALQDDDEKAYLAAHPSFRVAVEQLASSRTQDPARVFVPGGGARIGAALDRVVAGDDVRTVMAGLQSEIADVIAAEISPKLRT